MTQNPTGFCQKLLLCQQSGPQKAGLWVSQWLPEWSLLLMPLKKQRKIDNSKIRPVPWSLMKCLWGKTFSTIQDMTLCSGTRITAKIVQQAWQTAFVILLAGTSRSLVQPVALTVARTKTLVETIEKLVITLNEQLKKRQLFLGKQSFAIKERVMQSWQVGLIWLYLHHDLGWKGAKFIPRLTLLTC